MMESADIVDAVDKKAGRFTFEFGESIVRNWQQTKMGVVQG